MPYSLDAGLLIQYYGLHADSWDFLGFLLHRQSCSNSPREPEGSVSLIHQVSLDSLLSHMAEMEASSTGNKVGTTVLEASPGSVLKCRISQSLRTEELKMLIFLHKAIWESLGYFILCEMARLVGETHCLGVSCLENRLCRSDFPTLMHSSLFLLQSDGDIVILFDVMLMV